MEKAVKAQMRKKIRVIVAEDEAIIRKAIRLLAGSFKNVEILGEAGNGREAIELAKEFNPDLVLMDLVMPVMDGSSAASIIKSIDPGVKVIALTAYGDGPEVAAALAAGMDGAVLKKASPEELELAITTVAGGGNYLCEEVKSCLDRMKAGLYQSNAGPETRREQQVLNLIMSGMRAKDISKVLGISSRTVEKHRDNLRKKYGVTTVAELVATRMKDDSRSRS